MTDRFNLLAEPRPVATGGTPPATPRPHTTHAVWERCALRGRGHRGVVERAERPSAGLRTALRAVEAALGGSDAGRISAPSAGALYPYETVVVCDEGDATRAYLLDTGARLARQLDTDPRLHQVVVDARHSGLPDCRAVVVTVARPWLSVRKYGDRGWLYTQLDAAHASTHLLVAANHTHQQALLLGGAQVRSVDAALGLGARCRTAHSAVALGAPRDLVPTDAPWTLVHHSGLASPFLVVESAERLVWHDLGSGVRGAIGGPPPTVRPPLRADALQTLATATSLRHSAKDFRPATIPAQRLAELARTATAATTAADGVGCTLVAHRVSGLEPGAYEVVDGQLRPRPAGGPCAPAVVVDMCMGQAHLGDTCAAVVLHAPRTEVLDRGRAGLEQTLAAAGTIGHLLYLAAVGQGVGITAIGGFDARRWHDSAGLDASDEVLYVLMLGVTGAATVKADRAPQCHAHGER